MSRLPNSNDRGLHRSQAGSRPLRTKDFSDETYQDPSSRRNKGPKNISKYAMTVQKNKRRRKATTPSSVSDSSEDFDGEDASDEKSESEDTDDEDDVPAMLAPSQLGLLAGPGPELDNLFERAPSVESMFAMPSIDQEEDHELLLSAEQAAAYERQFFANSDDDELYEGVNNVSDSDENNPEYWEEQQIIADISDGEFDEDEILNDIDGMSAYGFGRDDSDEGTVAYPASSQGPDSANERIDRRVRFQVDEPGLLHPKLSESPTFPRSLQPSALPAADHIGFPGSAGGIHSDLAGPEGGPADSDDYDSDATADYLPPEELRMRTGTNNNDATGIPLVDHASPDRQSGSQSDERPKGPKWGVFIDNGDKPSGMLDATGKIMVITDPHLLGDEFVRQYNDSAAASPDYAFEDIVDGSEATDSDVHPLAGASAMLGNDVVLPADSALFTGIDLDSDMGDGEDGIQIEDVIRFEDEDTDESDAATPSTPVFVPPKTPASAREHRHLSSLNSNTVTAFRRSADTQYAAFQTTPSFIGLTELSSPSASAGSRKRKNTNESPYASPHYDGVTPVQRMSAYEHAQTFPQTPDTVRPNKRSRMMTA